MDILHAIGNTSLVRLRKVVSPGCADIYAKLEWENPTGSMKIATFQDAATGDTLLRRQGFAGHSVSF